MLPPPLTRRRTRMFAPPTIAVAAALAALSTAPALAGTTVRKGNETVSLAVSVVALPGATKANRGTKVRYVVKRGTVNGLRSSEDLRSITVSGPQGLRYNSGVLGTCDVAKVFADDKYKCPKNTTIGSGKGKADARPAVAALIDAKLTASNALVNFDADNKPRPGLPGVFIDADIGGGNSVGLSLDTKPNGTFVYAQGRAAPGTQAAYTIVNLDLTVGVLGRNGKPYVQLPATCPKNGKWRFGMVERHWSGLTLTATHDVRCKR